MEEQFLQVCFFALEPSRVLTICQIYQTPYSSPECLFGHTDLDEHEHDSKGGTGCHIYYRFNVSHFRSASLYIQRLCRGDIPEMIANVPPLNAGFALTDPNDPRYVYFLGVRERFGIFLHNASESLRQQGEENTVDAVQMLVSCFPPHDISSLTRFRFGPFEHICWSTATATIGMI